MAGSGSDFSNFSVTELTNLVTNLTRELQPSGSVQSVPKARVRQNELFLCHLKFWEEMYRSESPSGYEMFAYQKVRVLNMVVYADLCYLGV